RGVDTALRLPRRVQQDDHCCKGPARAGRRDARSDRYLTCSQSSRSGSPPRIVHLVLPGNSTPSYGDQPHLLRTSSALTTSGDRMSSIERSALLPTSICPLSSRPMNEAGFEHATRATTAGSISSFLISHDTKCP